MTPLSYVLREVRVSNMQSASPPTSTHATTTKPSSYPPIDTSLNTSRLTAAHRSSKDENLHDIFFCLSNDIPDELEEMWTLKRATPIDDEMVQMPESPSKHNRRTVSFFDSVPQSRDDKEECLYLVKELASSFQIDEEDDGFTVVLR